MCHQTVGRSPKLLYHYDVAGAGKSPKYQKVFDALQREIQSGRVKAGDRLPSDVHLSGRVMNVSPSGIAPLLDVSFAHRVRLVASALGPPPPYLQGAGAVNARGIIATGLLAIGNWGNGDADKDKILTDIADDQVEAGLTRAELIALIQEAQRDVRPEIDLAHLVFVSGRAGADGVRPRIARPLADVRVLERGPLVDEEAHPLRLGAFPEDLRQLTPELDVPQRMLADLGAGVVDEQVGPAHGLTETLGEVALGRLEQEVPAVSRLVVLVTDRVPHGHWP